jgi:hypothetical protein
VHQVGCKISILKPLIGNFAVKRGPNQNKCTDEVDECLEDADIVFIDTERSEAASHAPCRIVETKGLHFGGIWQENGMLCMIMGISCLGAFTKLRKATINFVMSVRLSLRMEQISSHWTDFQEI